MKPLVSVIVPTRNRADMLDEALRSIFRQTYPNFEVVVVDDGSTDHTPVVIRKHGDRIRVVHRQNTGRSLARNAGIAVARGDYISFLDDDDVWLPEKLARQVDVLSEAPSVDVVHGQVYVLRDGQRSAILTQPPARPSRDWVEQLIWGDCVCTPSVVMFRRKTLDENGGFDPSVEPCEDWELFIRVALAGAHFRFIGEPLADYRVHEGNTFLDRMNTGRIAVLKKVFAELPVPERLKVRQGDFLSWWWTRIGYDSYNLCLFHKAWRAWFEAAKLNPTLVSPALLFLAAKSLSGAGVLRWARRAKRLLSGVGP